jgi:hypothetical protein
MANIAVNPNCECLCCEQVGGAPRADFSYLQTDDDPCAFAFTDDSVSGACGGIVSWLWDFGDGNTSTSQNPTHTYSGDGPWDVTLTVTDDGECRDAVVRMVTCETLIACGTCTSCHWPRVARFKLAGLLEPPGMCNFCVALNGYEVVCDVPHNDLFPLDALLCKWYTTGYFDTHTLLGDAGCDFLDGELVRVRGYVEVESCNDDPDVANFHCHFEIRITGYAESIFIDWHDVLSRHPLCIGTYTVPFATHDTGSGHPCNHDETSPVDVTF